MNIHYQYDPALGEGGVFRTTTGPPPTTGLHSVTVKVPVVQNADPPPGHGPGSGSVSDPNHDGIHRPATTPRPGNIAPPAGAQQSQPGTGAIPDSEGEPLPPYSRDPPSFDPPTYPGR